MTTAVQGDLLLQIAEDHAAWTAEAMRHIRALAATRGAFQAHDLTVHGCPEPYSANSWGAAITAAAKAGLIVHHGYAKSTRPHTRGSLVRTWIGVSA